jgi:hypothetical protein
MQLPTLSMKKGERLSVLVGDRPRADGLIKVVADNGMTGYVPVNLLQAIDPSTDIEYGRFHHS